MGPHSGHRRGSCVPPSSAARKISKFAGHLQWQLMERPVPDVPSSNPPCLRQSISAQPHWQEAGLARRPLPATAAPIGPTRRARSRHCKFSGSTGSVASKAKTCCCCRVQWHRPLRPR
uniref:Uncharacterized protein n=1 Tax=Trypanosoma congolense (strain IL3000) TaxID=1068625 RepID=G0UTL0_TRYCI|nr:hypothetical protein, unlikely [Trypanosoma congolense IL3000]